MHQHKQPGYSDLHNDESKESYAFVPQCPQCNTVEIRNLIGKDDKSVFASVGVSSCTCHHPIFKCLQCNLEFEFSRGPTFIGGCPAINFVKVKKQYIESLEI